MKTINVIVDNLVYLSIGSSILCCSNVMEKYNDNSISAKLANNSVKLCGILVVISGVMRLFN